MLSLYTHTERERGDLAPIFFFFLEVVGVVGATAASTVGGGGGIDFRKPVSLSFSVTVTTHKDACIGGGRPLAVVTLSLCDIVDAP